MKLRIVPIMISAIASVVVLFGGWFAYHSLAMENPLNRIIQQLDGVETAKVVMTNHRVTVELQLADEANLREIYREFVAQGASLIGQRSIDIQISNDSSTLLDGLWATALFDVAQAMENKQYAQIPQTMEHLALEHAGLSTLTEMDEHHVYIRMNYQDQSKFIILSRETKMHIWSNEGGVRS